VLLNMIGNWLRNRRQRVCIKGRASSWITFCSGVPHGSVLGLVLFLIFINDLENEVSSNVHKFADNPKIFRELKDNKACSILQSELDKLVSWSQKWKMEFEALSQLQYKKQHATCKAASNNRTLLHLLAKSAINPAKLAQLFQT